MIMRTQKVQIELEPISIFRRPILINRWLMKIHRLPTSFVNEPDAQEGANGHDWTLESVHEELLFGGNHTGIFRHQWHVVAEQHQYGSSIR